MVRTCGPWLEVEPGREDVLNVEDWAEIRRLSMAEGLSIKEICRRLGVARNTVRSALRSDAPPSYQRERRGSIVDEVEPRIRELLDEFPRMPATVIAERIGWTRSMTVLKERVAELRPIYLPPDPCQRTEYRPGELAQWDLWQPDVLIPLGYDQAEKLWVIVGVAGYSRVIAAWMIPSRQTHDVLGGHLRCLQQLGGVPRRGVYDQEPAIGRWHGPKAVLTEEFQRFRGTFGMGAVLCKRGDPEAKGLVERANEYFETSFLPGRRFDSVDDFNAQLAGWLRKANQRIHGTIRCRPADRLCEDRGAMLGFPPVLPDPALRFGLRLGRDHYVRVDTNDYSINPRVIGRRIEVRVDLEWVSATCGGEEVARHRRSLAKHRTIIDPNHARILRQMRAEHTVSTPLEAAVEERDLTVYDRALGVA
jgi:transposase